jgi:glycosyltransferase involved in cell wall biosynthesis
MGAGAGTSEAFAADNLRAFPRRLFLGAKMNQSDVKTREQSGTPPDVIVATHYWSPGWASALDEYLRAKGVRYRWIGHPLFSDGSQAGYRLHLRGEQLRSFDAPGARGPLRYLVDLVRTVRWSNLDGPTDLFIAGDNLLALAGLWLRRRGHVRAVVMYTIDFVPRRFRNPLANALYHAIDRFAVGRVDIVWNTSAGVIEGRAERDKGPASTPQLVVPIGAEATRLRGLSRAGRRRTIAYLGHLLEKQGLQVVVAAMPIVLGRFPDARLLVIGDGPFRGELERQAAELGVTATIEFAGFSDDHPQIEGRLLTCSIGVAPYVPGEANYSRFQDLPGKIVNYLACGLAVLTTEVPQGGRRLEETGAGHVLGYSPEAFAGAICAYLDDPELLRRAAAGAISLGADYDWSAIFHRAFAETAGLVPAAAAAPGRGQYEG